MSTITITTGVFSLSARFPENTPQTAVLQQLLTSLRELGVTSEVISTASTPTAPEETTGSSEQPSGTKPTSSLIWDSTVLNGRQIMAMEGESSLWLATVPREMKVTQEMVEALYSALRKKTGPA